MTTVTIKANHPVRNKVASLPDYYGSRTDALIAISKALAEYDLEFDGMSPTMNASWSDDEGFTVFPLRTKDLEWYDGDGRGESVECNNAVAFSWYKVREGRWEVVKYVS